MLLSGMFNHAGGPKDRWFMPSRRLRVVTTSVGVVVSLAVCAQGGGAAYTVRAGDTLTAVARSLKTSVSALATTNHLADPNRIYVGQVLQLPPGSGPGADPPAHPGAPAPQPGPIVDGPVAVYPPGSAPLVTVSPARVLAGHPDRRALGPMFDRAAHQAHVPANLLKAIAWQESGWQNNVFSVVRAQGIGQLMPGTVTFVNALTGQHLDPSKPADNITLEAALLAFLLYNARGDQPTAIAGYYQGLASVQQRGLYDDTKAYVANVVALRAMF
ncbi:MAG TPA: transglycosylase SLT domain-containing protein [Acidimicrobiales bacterium]